MRDELRSLDLAEPPEQWADIQRRGPRPSGPPSPSPTRRIVTGTVALLVGIAGVTFAIDALSSGPRGRHSQNPAPSQIVPMGTDGSVLWPYRTAVQLEQDQAAMDGQPAGGLRSHLYPAQIVQQFSSRVLGWRPSAHPTIIHGPSVNGRPTATARLTEPNATCPAPTPVGQSSAPCVANVEVIHLTQPVRVGEGGIWAITSVTSSVASIDAPPGGVVTNGDSVAVHSDATGAGGAQAGFVLGDYSPRRTCSAAGGGSTEQPTTTLHVRVAADVVAGSDCGVSAPGYIWVASPANGSGGAASSVQPPVADPFSGGAAPYSFVVAVPVLVRIPENALPVGTASYTFPSGWTADYPSGWTAVTTYAPGSVAGISNASTPFRLKSMDVGLTVSSNAVSNAAPKRDDSRFPLWASDFQVEPGPGYRSDLTFRGNGVTYHAQLYVGPDALPADVAAMNQVIASIRFPSLGQQGRQVNGYSSLGPAVGYRIGVGTAANVPSPRRPVFVLRGSASTYALVIPTNCGQGEGRTWGWDAAAQQIVTHCPNGSDIRYRWDGAPLPGNPAGYGRRLVAFPVIEAWDGTLLLWPHHMHVSQVRNAWSG